MFNEKIQMHHSHLVWILKLLKTLLRKKQTELATQKQHISTVVRTDPDIGKDR